MTAPVLKRLFDWKIRGVRWVEIIGVVCVAAMVLSVYIAKSGAAREDARIAELEREIDRTRQRVRLLNAQIARLEDPARIESLSRQAGLAPVDVGRRVTEGELWALSPVAPAPTEDQSDDPPEILADPAADISDPGGEL